MSAEILMMSPQQNCLNCDTWIALGSSATAPTMVQRAREDYPFAKLITTNSGIKLVVPDYYFLSDRTACKLFAEKAARLRQSHGMKLITLRRKQSNMQKRGVDASDFQLDLLYTGQPLDFQRGVYNDCMFSGLYCIQFAIENGAKRIVAVGHEGYPSEADRWSTWDNETSDRAQLRKHTERFLAPWWNKVVKICDDIEFVFYGNLNYEIDGPNVTKVPAKKETYRCVPILGSC